MDDSLDDENALVSLTVFVVLGVGLTALFLGYEWFWMAFVLGFGVLLPMVKVLADRFGDDGVPGERHHRTESRSADEPESKQDPLDTLRDRYARGDLTEAEFEREVEALLETETPESARDHVERRSGSRNARDADDATLETDENS